MPWTASEFISHKKSLDEDGYAEGNVGRNRADAEDGTDRHTPEDEKLEGNTHDGVEPNGVDGG